MPVLPIKRVAADAGLKPDEIETHGPLIAKVRLAALRRLADAPTGRLILVTAMTPTPAGEGKTVTTIGLSLGLAATGRRAIACLRQPSLGPLLGMKGGGAGGGAARLEPYDRVSVHGTGDLHAVAAAHNWLAALADEALRRGRHGLVADRLAVTRVLDLNDRALRQVRVGLGTPGERTARFEATAASEVMAILALADSLRDLRARCGRMLVGHAADGRPVTAADLSADGAMAALLRDAIQPNLVQTGEGTPVLLHAGPFANIAHGNSSVLADRLALRLADYVVTEAGFGADMGAEKFFNIKCRASGHAPALAVLVASVRALKFHGLGRAPQAGGALPPELARPDPALVERGAPNLARQIGVVLAHGVPVVVALNRFPGDSTDELRAAGAAARAAGALDAVVSDAFECGGAGAAALADAVATHAGASAGFRPLYPDDAPLGAKIAAICTRVYGADGVDFDPSAAEALAALAATPLARAPVCMAKTQYSLTADPTRLGAPTGFRIPVREVRAAAGAGFVVARCGDISTMPGLPARPRGCDVDVGEDDGIVGI